LAKLPIVLDVPKERTDAWYPSSILQPLTAQELLYREVRVCPLEVTNHQDHLALFFREPLLLSPFLKLSALIEKFEVCLSGGHSDEVL